MDSFLWELINIGKVVVYMDDILIFIQILKEYCNIID